MSLILSLLRCSSGMWKAPVMRSFFLFWISSIFPSIESLVMNL